MTTPASEEVEPSASVLVARAAPGSPTETKRSKKKKHKRAAAAAAASLGLGIEVAETSIRAVTGDTPVAASTPEVLGSEVMTGVGTTVTVPAASAGSGGPAAATTATASSATGSRSDTTVVTVTTTAAPATVAARSSPMYGLGAQGTPIWFPGMQATTGDPTFGSQREGLGCMYSYGAQPMMPAGVAAGAAPASSTATGSSGPAVSGAWGYAEAPVATYGSVTGGPPPPPPPPPPPQRQVAEPPAPAAVPPGVAQHPAFGMPGSPQAAGMGVAPFMGYWPGPMYGYPPMYAPMAPPPAPETRARPWSKKLRIPKFKGKDGNVSVTAWLKMLQTEVRNQATSMRVAWTPHELYNAATALFDGDAMEWFSSLDTGLTPDEETIDNWADLMKEHYMITRSEPETIEMLNRRRQARGESLGDFAQNLRRIVAGRHIEEKWLVNAFLSGMSNQTCATHVRVALGRGESTLREAVQAAVLNTGEYGEGVRVGLLDAERAHDARQGAAGPAVVHGEAKPAAIKSERENVASGQHSYGATPTHGGPRYDIEGRLVGNTDGKSESEWWRNVPPGFKIVPDGSSAGGQAAARSSNRRQDEGRGPKTDGAGQGGRRGGRTLKVEGVHGSAYATAGSEAASLPNREERMRNHQRFMNGRSTRTGFVPRDKVICFYCQRPGHYSRDCEYKREDYGQQPSSGAATDGSQDQNTPAGNEQQA